MGIATEQVQPEKLQARMLAQRVVYWMALFTTVVGALYLFGLMAKLIVNGTVHAVSSQGVQTLTATVALLWDVGLLILFAAMRRQGVRSRRLFAELALIFMTLVCATSTINWFVQLVIVPKLGTGATNELRALLDVNNDLSITYALEHLGWGLFYALAAIFASAASAATGSGKLEVWIRWLFLAGGALSLLHFIGVVVDSPRLGDLGYVAWGLFLPATTALLAVKFQKEA
jgi:hypothetical protein